MTTGDAGPSTPLAAARSETIEYAEVPSERTDEVLEFYVAHHPAGEQIARQYRWRLDGLPHSGGVRTYAARTGRGRMVGAVNVVPVTLHRRGSVLTGSWQQDTFVLDELRGRGVGRALVDAAAQGWDVVLGKGTLPDMYELKKKIGFLDAANQNVLLRVLSPRSRSGSLRRRALFPMVYAYARLVTRDVEPVTLRAEPIARFDEEFDALADQLAASEEILPYKPSGYLNWRYLSCPGRSYRILRILDPARVRGAVVLRLDSAPGRDGWIVDMIYEPHDAEAGHALVSAALLELKERKAPCVRVFVSSDAARELLQARGFLDTGETPRFTYRFPAEIGGELRSASWNFWHGDGDTELLG